MNKLITIIFSLAFSLAAMALPPGASVQYQVVGQGADVGTNSLTYRQVNTNSVYVEHVNRISGTDMTGYYNRDEAGVYLGVGSRVTPVDGGFSAWVDGTDTLWTNGVQNGSPEGWYYAAPAGEDPAASGILHISYSNVATRVYVSDGKLFRKVGDGSPIEVYDAGNPPPSLAGAGDISVTNGVISLSGWIPDMVIDTFFKNAIRDDSNGGGFVGGPGYVFNDDNGILPSLSSGYVFASPWYINTAAAGSSEYYIVGTSGKAYITAAAGVYGTGSRSYSMWFKTSQSSGVNQMLSYGNKDFTSGRAIMINTCNGTPGFAAWGRDLSGEDSVADGEWHMLVARYNLATDLMDLWIDGVQAAFSEGDGGETVPYIDTEQVGSDPVRIGEELVGPAQRLNGGLDDICIWTRALTDLEIVGLYNAGSPVAINVSVAPYNDGLKAAWALNEGTGSTLTSIVNSYDLEFITGVAWESYGATTTITNDLTIVSTNAVLPVGASKARVQAMISSASEIDPVDVRLGIVDVVNDFQYWSDDVSLISQFGTNMVFGGTVSNVLYEPTSISAILSVDAVDVGEITVKAMAAPCSP